MADIAQRVQVIREDLKLTQKQVAERAGIARKTLSRVETGSLPRPSADLVENIAKGLGVPPGELFKAPREVYETTRGVRRAPKGTPVEIPAFGVGRGEGFAALSLNDALSQLRILTADWERGGLSDEDLVEGVGKIHRQLQQLVA